jgi:hypothetical protein
MEAARARYRTGGAHAASLLAWSLAALLCVALFAARLVLFMLARLEGDVVAVVRETVQPEHASVWVCPPLETGNGVGAER